LSSEEEDADADAEDTTPCGRGSRGSSHGPQLVTISFVANSFLYRQVRNMVGCLVEVGKQHQQHKHIHKHKNNINKGGGGGRHGSNDVKDLIQNATDRKFAPYTTAPPQGLFLVDVQHGSFRF